VRQLCNQDILKPRKRNNSIDEFNKHHEDMNKQILYNDTSESSDSSRSIIKPIKGAR